MVHPSTAVRFLPLALAVGAACGPGRAQEGVPPPPGLVPEQMWPAPTAADWQKPVPIQWQRTWGDAVRIAQATKRPILVCVNMDGEIASEHYAGIRYRDPEICKLYEPYVCVIASVYRHNPRDYDEQGRRIPCPRLGCVTCGEHIAMEPLVYAKFLDGKRISPRHIMVELDGTKTYDVFYTWDTQSVFDTIQKGITDRRVQTVPLVKGDRSLLEKVASPDSQDRAEVEAAFAKGTKEQQQALLQAALQLGAEAPVELLRQAAYGLDPELGKQARQGMLAAKDPGTVDLIADTLRAALPPDERAALVEALGRFAGESSKARTFANAHKGFAQETAAIDTGKWLSVLEGPAYQGAPTAGDVARTATDRDEALRAAPQSPEARLLVAEANVLQALATPPGGNRRADRLRTMLFEDAQRAAHAAVTLGASGWRLDAVLALCAKARGSVQESYDLAISAAPQLPPDAPGPLAMEVLALFAEARQEAIVAAVRAQRDFPPQWTTDVHAAYAVLGRHPLGRAEHVANHFDFLDFFGTPTAEAVLDQGLQRFPAAAELHQRLRQRLLAHGSPDALEADYRRRLAATDAPPELPWFAGYASLCAAEAHRRAHRGPAALAAYQRARDHYATYAATTGNQDGAHYVAMGHAGTARVQLEAGALDDAWAALQAAFTAAPLAAAATDGLGITAVQTADMLQQQAKEQQRPDLAEAVAKAVATLPAEALQVPEYERGQPNARPQRRRRG